VPDACTVWRASSPEPILANHRPSLVIRVHILTAIDRLPGSRVSGQ
jgi:hypothetical protein